MKCTILHEGKGRMRVHVEKVRMTLHRADVLEAYLNHHDAIVHAAVYERTGDVVITYTGRRSAAIAVLAGYKFDVAEYDALVTSADSRRLNREYQDKMFDLVAGRCLRKLFLPAPLDAAYTAFRSIRFLWKGVRCVLSRRLEVEVLDALSIGVSLLRGDFGTARFCHVPAESGLSAGRVDPQEESGRSGPQHGPERGQGMGAQSGHRSAGASDQSTLRR